MNASTATVPLPSRVLFLSRGESSVKMDVQALRGLGVSSFVHCGDSAAALTLLAGEGEAPRSGKEQGDGPGPELVVCDEQLGDAPASAFLYAMAQNPALRPRPVLALSGSSAGARALRAAGVYVLERPYTPQDLSRMVQKATSPRRRILRPHIFEQAAQKKSLPLLAKSAPKARRPLPGPLTTSDWFRKGIACLEAGDLTAAENAFDRVLRRQEGHADACLGLARVRRARKDQPGMCRSLIRAAAACARQGDRARADAILAVLPEHMRGNLFMREAIACMEEDEYRLAALSLLDANRDNPEKTLHRIVSRACLLMPKPEESMNRLCGAYDGLGHRDTARTLRKRLLAYEPYEEQELSSWLDRFPLLKEAASVAGYAAWAWKRA